MDLSLFNEVKITKVADAASSAGTDVNGSTIDMTGFEGVCFVSNITTANAGNYLKAQEGDTTSPTADLAGSKVTADDGNDVVMLDVYKPLKRYIRPVLVRGGANTVTGEVYAIQYGMRKAPQSNDLLNSRNAVALVSPIAGTP